MGEEAEREEEEWRKLDGYISSGGFRRDFLALCKGHGIRYFTTENTWTDEEIPLNVRDQEKG
jgi:hypothetical protein